MKLKIIINKKQSQQHIEVATTTESKLVKLHNYLKNNEIKKGVAIDAMCGSGALGIYLLKFGFEKVIFNDIYPQAIENLCENLEVYAAEIEDIVLEEKFDIVSLIGVIDFKEDLEQAMSECLNLEEVVLPDNLKNIGESCFFRCISLMIRKVKSYGYSFSLYFVCGLYALPRGYGPHQGKRRQVAACGYYGRPLCTQPVLRLQLGQVHAEDHRPGAGCASDDRHPHQVRRELLQGWC